MAPMTADMPAYQRDYYATHRAAILERNRLRRRAQGIPSVVERKAATAARAARFCRTCASPLPKHASRYCSPACKPVGARPGVKRELVCARPGCDVAFTTQKPNRRYCSEACHRMATFDRAGRGKGRRFPRVRYAQRRRILERDGWTCQLCHAPIDPKLTFPHPGSASIDHRDPDGEHVDANLQAAHLGCNVEKGRKHHLGAAA